MIAVFQMWTILAKEWELYKISILPKHSSQQVINEFIYENKNNQEFSFFIIFFIVLLKYE